MAFAVWVDQECAWAEGTHEYRPMGVAVVSVTDLFRARDFDPRRRAPSRRDVRFVGFFASLGDVNQFLLLRRDHLPTRPTPAFLL